MEEKKYLKIENLSIELKSFRLNNISFDLEKGDYLCIIGPTGAGKTILLESITGIYKLKNGRILLNGSDITNLTPEKRKIGIIYQDYALFPHLNVRKNIEYGSNKKDENKLLNLCKLLKIENLLNRFPETLSGGEKQRVALARALIVEPKLLLMDEPFSALDNQTRFKIRQLLREITKKLDLTVIHITHDFDDVWALANKIAIIKEGNLIQFGTIEDIMFRPKNEFVAEFTGTNILNGKVVKVKNNLTFIDVNGELISSIDKAEIGENIKIAIRPESIILFKKEPKNLSARNVIIAKYEDYFVENKVCHVVLQIGNFKIKALLTISAFEEFNFKKGDKVYLIIKATNVRII